MKMENPQRTKIGLQATKEAQKEKKEKKKVCHQKRQNKNLVWDGRDRYVHT